LIEPLVISWGWQSDTPSPSTFVDYLEWQGTRDISSFLTVPDAIRYQQIHHWSEVWRASHDLCQFVRRELTNFTGLEPLCPDSSEWYAQMATSQLPVKCDVASLKIALYERFHIEVPVHEWNGRKLIRYSFQAYNQQADAEKLVEAVKALI
jgi:isopenicillin-N epimerase